MFEKIEKATAFNGNKMKRTRITKPKGLVKTEKEGSMKGNPLFGRRIHRDRTKYHRPSVRLET